MRPVEASSCAEQVANKFGGGLMMREVGQSLMLKAHFVLFKSMIKQSALVS